MLALARGSNHDDGSSRWLGPGHVRNRIGHALAAWNKREVVRLSSDS